MMVFSEIPKEQEMEKKVLIAMSGGVDSSVAAALLKESGFECVGVTMKLFASEDLAAPQSGCCSLSDIEDARAVAFRLGIPHYALNFTEDFKKSVIRDFIEVYERGETPNPCIECNRKLKFEKLLLRARQLGFHYIATGHYAQIDRFGGRFLLKKAVDPKKDQSYALYTMTQGQLSRTLFPLGGLTKAETREIAGKNSFINAKKRDSQDICFVPDRDYAKFIEQYTGKPASEGDIIDKHGEILGRHKGIIRYTIGQRRGLGLAFNEPRYVTAKSAIRNTVTLGGESDLYAKTLIARNINLIACERLDRPVRVTVKTRYLQKEQAALAEQTAPDEVRIVFDEAQRAITPGQSAVFYEGDIVVGGGVIAGLASESR
jgi:tRNA-specific 2-thiouridylase